MLLVLVGLLAIVSQIILLRELNVAFYGVELVYALALAAWMTGAAAGAALAPRGLRASVLRLRVVLAAVSVALPAEIAVIRASRAILGGTPGAYLPFHEQVGVMAVTLLPPAAALGLAFKWAADLSVDDGRSLARSYAVESGGSVIGAGIATVAFTTGIQTLPLAILAAGLIPATLLATAARRRRGTASLAAAILLVVAGASARMSGGLDLRMTAWNHPAVVETSDSPYARVTATTILSQTVLFVDDVLVYESESTEQEELAHVAALQHPSPRRVLVLGGSAERLDLELGRHGPLQVDAVELDRTYFDVANRHLRLGRAPVIADPRDYLRRSADYDVIVNAMPQPTSGQSNRFYTREFFEECRDHLTAGGVLAFRLASPENVLTPLQTLRTASIIAAVRAGFRSVEVLQGTSVLVLASDEPLPARADVLVERWNARHLEGRLVGGAYLRYLYENDRRTALGSLRTVGVVPNSDARPVCYQFAALNWLAKFYPGLLRLDPSAFAFTSVAPSAIGVLVIFLVARRWRAARAALLAGAAGVAGMLIETVLLLAYQARSGALYERIGLLLMAFMAGLALGAWVVDRLAIQRRGGVAVKRATAVALAGTGTVGALTASLVIVGGPMGLAVTGLLQFAAGAAVAGLFACAAASAGVDGGAAPGTLYGADLAGGALGSLVAGLVLVPLAGLAPTSWTAVGICLAAWLLA